MTTFHFAHDLNKLHDGRAADCPECAASTETNHGARIPLPDEQHFTGLRVSVEGSALPPDNPPSPYVPDTREE